MVIFREHLEALFRWHHLTDYLVTIGGKKFTEEPEPTPEQVYQAIRRGAPGTLFDPAALVPSSTEETIRRLDGLRASRNPYQVCTGPTVSLRRLLLREVGASTPRWCAAGTPSSPIGSPRRGRCSYRTCRHRPCISACPPSAASTARRSSVWWRPIWRTRSRCAGTCARNAAGRWLVPYVEIVLDVAGAAESGSAGGVRGVLDGKLQDGPSATLVAPWSRLRDGRGGRCWGPAVRPRHDAGDLPPRPPDQAHRRGRADARPHSVPLPGPVDVPLHRATLERMIETVQKDLTGVLIVDLPDGRTARLERTSALARARLLADPGDDLDDIIDTTHGVRHGPRTAIGRSPRRPRRPASDPGPEPRRRPDTGERTLLGRLKSALRPEPEPAPRIPAQGGPGRPIPPLKTVLASRASGPSRPGGSHARGGVICRSSGRRARLTVAVMTVRRLSWSAVAAAQLAA